MLAWLLLCLGCVKSDMLPQLKMGGSILWLVHVVPNCGIFMMKHNLGILQIKQGRHNVK